MPLLHLRALNPHVATALDGCGLTSVMAPRQPKPLPASGPATGSSSDAGSGDMLCIGVSAFAFQGTNAHAVVGSLPTDSSHSDRVPVARPAAGGVLHWQRQRLWVHPPLSPLALRALALNKHQVTREVKLRAHYKQEKERGMGKAPHASKPLTQ